MTINNLPMHIQQAVKSEIGIERHLQACRSMPYWKVNGFKSVDAAYEAAYTSFQVSPEHIQETVEVVMFQRYQMNGFELEGWMQAIPNAERICKARSMALVG